MDVCKRKIIKSKSSNTALVRKVERKQPKSKSNGQIESFPKTVKKRGVYVENRSIMSLNAQGPNIPKEKSSPPPRVGRKRFLNSVLSILSKSSSSTQYPDKNDTKPKLKQKTSNEKNKPTSSLKEVTQMTKESAKFNSRVQPEKRKKKFRSRVLSKDRDYTDKFEVIQRKKEIRFSPLESLSTEDFIWSDLPKLVKESDEERASIANIVKEITEGRKLADSKLEKDPTTLVADPNKNDKKLYNFFVDLIETTFTLYDVKDTVKPVRSRSSSKVNFEIDEQVAQKLKMTKPTMFDDVTQKPSRQNNSIKKTNLEINDDKIRYYYTDETSYPMSSHSCQRCKSPVKRQKLKSASFSNSKYRQPKYVKILSPSTESIKQKTPKKKNPSKKQNLLNILREEIAKHPSVYEEPQSIYEALKVMARNKRRCQKNLRFADVKINKSDIRDEDCMKKRKVMRPSASFRYNKKISQNTPEGINLPKSKVPETYGARKGTKSKVPETYDARKGRKSKVPESYDARKGRKSKVPETYDARKGRTSKVPKTPETEYENSFHSIEVYGFDYDKLPMKSKYSRRKREVSLPYHSSSSECDCD